MSTLVYCENSDHISFYQDTWGGEPRLVCTQCECLCKELPIINRDALLQRLSDKVSELLEKMKNEPA